jgi:DNA-binding transcriptional LysR family regulator
MMSANHICHKFMKVIHMNLSQLQSLVALADKGSFTEAGYEVNLTQSAVSHALAALENELGVTLIERNRKGIVALTGVGQKIMPHVRALLAQVEAIEQEARAASGLASGKLRLGITQCFSPSLLASVLTRFERQYPAVEVVMFEGTIQEVGEWLDSSIIDVGFLSVPTTGMDNILITTDELCAVVAAGHRLSSQNAVTANDLRDEGFIMPKSECSLQMMEMAGVEAGRIKSALRFQASDSATILAMVRESLGISLLPRMMLPNRLEGVVALPLDPPQPMQVGVAIRAREVASPAAKLFIQTALSLTQVQPSVLPAAG